MNFGMIILSHQRPQNIKTLRTLQRSGYTGKIIILVDDEDPELETYKEEYPDKLHIFNKEKALKKSDRGENEQRTNTPLAARNTCHKVAKQHNLDYFMVLDDDYGSIRIRFNKKGEFISGKNVENLDYIIQQFIELYKTHPQTTTITFAQGGDYIGGEKSYLGSKIRTKRKAMNTFLCKTTRPFKFKGNGNDDVNTYIRNQQLGQLMYMTSLICINQEETQTQKGGNTEFYLDTGTYQKSMYTVMINPSCTELDLLGPNHPRIHHRIKWKNAVPKLISDKYRKN